MDLIGSGSGGRDARLGLPRTAFAGSPLLSGYGGPGAGEQAILGSTLMGGSRRRLGGSGGASGSGGEPLGLGGSVRAGGSAGGPRPAAAKVIGARLRDGRHGRQLGCRCGPGQAGTAKSRTGEALTPRAAAASRARRRCGRHRRRGRAGVSAYVYPTSQGSLRSARPCRAYRAATCSCLLSGSSPRLRCVAVLTMRLSRLQS